MSRMLSKECIKELFCDESLEAKEIKKRIQFIYRVVDEAGFETKCFWKDYIPFTETVGEDFDVIEEYDRFLKSDSKIYPIYGEDGSKRYGEIHPCKCCKRL
jgi:hypothetical protein